MNNLNPYYPSVSDGISLCTSSKNRREHLEQAIESWTRFRDIDEIIISPVSGLTYLSISGAELSNCYIGSIPISDYCGTKAIKGTRTNFNRYGVLTDGRTDYYVKLVGEVAWTN